MTYRLTEPARRQIKDILAYSRRHYGRESANRYGLLIKTALDVVGDSPDLRPSRPVAGAIGLRDYEIRHARSRLPQDQHVANPRHKVVYQSAGDGIVEVLAVIGVSLPSALGPER